MTSPIEEISIYRPDLTLTNGVQTRSRYLNTESASGDFPVTDSCERNATVMGDDYVRLIFNLTKRIQFDAFSYIEYAGQTFFLKEAYRPKNNGTFRENGQAVSAYYSYDMKFVSVANMLTKHTCLRNVQVVGESWNEPEININGTLETLYTMIIGSIEQAANRIRNNSLYYKHCLLSIVANKDKGRLTQGTDLMTFQFSGTNIADALTTIANGYDETEWYIAEDTAHAFVLHICKCEDTESSVLHLSDEEYTNTGADKNLHPTLSGGLRSCEYAQEWTGIVERIMPFGSDRNMVKNMGTDTNTNMIVSYGKRLRLDPHHQVVWNGKTTPTDDMIANGYTGAYIVHDKDGNNVLLLVDKDGAVANPDTNVTTGIEEVVMYDDVYPQCHFKITKVEEQTKRIDGELQPRYTIEGVAVDEDKYPKSVLANIGMFPIKIMEAETLSVLFESGYLNGREFEITNKTTKDAGVTEYSLRFTIVADGDITEGTLIPSGNFIPRVGDQFALFNMKMPDEFIDIAKDELAQKAYEDLVELANTRPEVKCVADERMFAQYDVYLGRRMEISSEIFVSDAAFVSRVISFSHSLTSPESLSFSLASAIMQGTLSSMESAIGENVQAIGGLDQRAVNLSRRGWRDTAEMAEMLDSLAAEMMVVGVEKNQFAFTSAILCRNDSDCGTAGSIDHFHHLTIGNGTLQHTQKEWIDQHDGLWIIEPIDQLNTCNLTDESVNTEANRAKPYYLYAFCQADNEYAQLHLLDMDYCAAHNIEGDNQYLLLGILSSEFEDGNTSYRVFNRSNGYTAVVGGTITTEQIQDANRSLIIDFQSNPPRIIARNGAEIIGSIKFKASDTLTAEEQLEALGMGVDGAKAAAEEAQATADGLKWTNILKDKNIVHKDGGQSGGFVYTLIYASLNKGTYIATRTQELVEEEFGGGTITGCLVAFRSGKKPTSDFSNSNSGVYGIYEWGETIAANTPIDLYACMQSYDTLYDCYGHGEDYSNTGIIQPPFTWCINGLNLVTYTQDANTALDYLRAALTDGSTEIAGGLTMTNVLMLKNLQGEVTAGMSGLTKLPTDSSKSENVLLWGGGTYEDAYNAAESEEYYKKGSTTPITTLLKKDGTGKIGGFRILDKDSIAVINGDRKILITTKSLSDSKTTSRTQTVSASGTTSIVSPIVEIPNGEPILTKQVTIQGDALHKISLSFLFDLNMKLSATENIPDTTNLFAYGRFRIVLYNGTTLVKEVSVPAKSGNITLDRYADGNTEYDYSVEDGYLNADIRLCPISNYTGDHIGIQYEEDMNDTYNIVLKSGTLTIKVFFDGYMRYTTDGVSGYGFIDNAYIYASVNGSVTSLTKEIIIANDGITARIDSSNEFTIMQGNDGKIQIYAIGLPTSSTGLDKGRLFQNGDYLCIKT